MRIIFDLDGTLADNTHRMHFLDQEPKDWDGFFAACSDDAPMIALEVFRQLSQNPLNRISIWSGRGVGPNNEVEAKTVAWLHDHLIDPGYYDIRMRGHEDYTPDEQLKAKWLEEESCDGVWPDLVFDDRQKVVDMWRERGIPCFQVAPGDF